MPLVTLDILSGRPAATADAGNASAMDESMADSPAVGSNADESVLPQAEASFVTNQQLEAAGGSDGIDAYELARTQVTKVAKSAVSMKCSMLTSVFSFY